MRKKVTRLVAYGMKAYVGNYLFLVWRMKSKANFVHSLDLKFITKNGFYNYELNFSTFMDTFEILGSGHIKRYEVLKGSNLILRN